MIYENPKAYAEKTQISIELAEVRCQHFLESSEPEELDLVLTFADLKSSALESEMINLIGFEWNDFVQRDTNAICLEPVLLSQ